MEKEQGIMYCTLAHLGYVRTSGQDTLEKPKNGCRTSY